MSSHFNYEIDERNLRVKLKDMNMPYKEEAWIQFENYSDEHRTGQKKTSLPAFHLNINRTLILPFVFGGVIIGFSLLLFNFISIKNKPEAEGLVSNKMAGEPKKDVQTAVIHTETKAVDTVKTIITDTVPRAKADTLRTELPVLANTVAVNPMPTPTVAAISNPPAGTWTSIEALEVYESPNIASKVIGSSIRNQTYSALEETNYFIKITLDQSGKTGFVRKNFLRKNNGQNSNTRTPHKTARKKSRQAEVLESIQAPVKISEENEPELR